MAKSKQDYIALGREHGSVNAPRWANFTKNSWQENAYDLGYNEGYREYVTRGVALAVDAEAERTAKDLETVGQPVTTGTEAGEVFRQSRNAMHGDEVRLRVSVPVAEAVKANPKGAVDALSKYGVPGSVIEHINYLHRQRSTCTDEKRRLRLLTKIDALRDKWQKRSAAVYERAIRA